MARRIYLTEYNSGRIVVIDCLRGSNNIYCSTDSSFCTRRHLHNANQGVCNTGYRYGSDNNNGMSGVLKRRYIRLGGVETKEANCTTAGLAINSGGDLLAVAVQPPYPYIDGDGEHGVRVFDRLREIELYRLVFDDAGCRLVSTLKIHTSNLDPCSATLFCGLCPCWPGFLLPMPY